MTAYQPGDRFVRAGGELLRLRLTLGALVDISERLGAPGPESLSGMLRNLNGSDARDLLRALSGRRDAILSDEEVKAALPAMCEVFEMAFNSGIHSEPALSEKVLGSTEYRWPFDAWFKLAITGWGISSADFWNMTVRDFLAALGTAPSVAMTRENLRALSRAFPDGDPHE